VTQHGRTFLAIADGLDALGRYAFRDQVVLDGCRATLAERNVVFTRAALVAMAFDRDLEIGVFFKPDGLTVERLVAFGRDFGRVEIKEYAIGDRRS
jgi:hypothetical protein